MNLSDQLEVFVPTHIINANSDPVIKNTMIEKTIRSAHKHLSLKNVKFNIYPDSKFKDTHPELMNMYLDFLTKMAEKLTKDNIYCIVDNNENTVGGLRGSWETYVNKTKAPYMLFLEHDWKFLRNINCKNIIDTFEKNEFVNYIKLPRYKLTANYMNSICTHNNWEWMFQEVTEFQSPVPLSRISFFSGNPHFSRVSFAKDFLLRQLYINGEGTKKKGGAAFEKELKQAQMKYIDSHRSCGYRGKSNPKSWGHTWHLSAPFNPGKGCIMCQKAIARQHFDWGHYMYGGIDEEPVIDHLGDWCRKS